MSHCLLFYITFPLEFSIHSIHRFMSSFISNEFPLILSLNIFSPLGFLSFSSGTYQYSFVSLSQLSLFFRIQFHLFPLFQFKLDSLFSGISILLSSDISNIYSTLCLSNVRPLLVGTIILVFLSIFTKSQASSPFEALNSAHLSMCQQDVRPSVQKSWRTMAFSRVSTGDSVTLHLVR